MDKETNLQRGTDDQLIRGIAGKRGFLASYIPYCCDCTDAPEIFHLGVGLSIVGTALGNKVKFRSYGHQELFPNLWIVLVAPSGFMRKTTALNLGKKLLRRAVGKSILSDDWTPEKLYDLLKDEPSRILMASEFTGLLQRLDRQYMLGSRELLTELYDGDLTYEVERKGSGKVRVENVALSLLGATTMEWLNERVRGRDLAGGFLARFLFLPGEERGPRVERIPDVTVSVQNSLAAHLVEVAEMRGYADFSQVQQGFSDWLYEYERKMEKSGMADRLGGMYSRTGTTTLKLAVIFQASLQPNELTISPEAMDKAQRFVTYIHRQTAMVAGGFADSWDEKQQYRVLKFLKERGGRVVREELYRYMQINSRKLDGVMVTLREQGRVEISQARSDGRGRPMTIYTFMS